MLLVHPAKYDLIILSSPLSFVNEQLAILKKTRTLRHIPVIVVSADVSLFTRFLLDHAACCLNSRQPDR